MSNLPGKWVVLEGIDATGKSTQLDLLAKKFPEAYCTHQPSGDSEVGKLVYELTERGSIRTSLARQLLHLASHAEHYDQHIIPALIAGKLVFQDRCWWSTIAYGWYPSPELQRTFPYDQFLSLVRAPCANFTPDLILLFDKPYKDDPHNTPDVIEGYKHLLYQYRSNTVVMPKRKTALGVNTVVMDALLERGIVEVEGW